VAGVLVSALALVLALPGCDPQPISEGNPPGDGGITDTIASDTGASDKPTGPVTPHDKPTGCHPFSQGKETGDCLLPFPSSYFTVADSNSPTGMRLSFPNQTMPISNYNENSKLPIDPAPLNKRSGFSPGTPIMVLFPERVDPALLVKSTDVKQSIDPNNPIQLIEFGTQTRIPFFAEVDRTVGTDKEPQLLFIRPMVRLKPNTRYVVVLRKTLKAVGGGDLTPPASYVRLAKGEAPTTPAEAALAPKILESLKAAKTAGINADEILITWDFHTASDDPILDQMIYMRDEMLKRLDNKGPEYTITNVFNYTEAQKKDITRIVQGTFKVPTFVDKTEPGAKLVLDANGKPKVVGMTEYKFQLHIPRCALTKGGPLPIMQFGHGIFGGAKGEMDSGYQRGMINRLCMVQIGHDWLGLTAEDRGYVAVEILSDMNKMVTLVNRLQQAHINAIALTRLVTKRLITDKALEIDGKPIIDGKEVYYLGISNGAIQGAGFMALSPDVKKGILNVGGGPWNLMMTRSSNFEVLYTVMKVFYNNPIERQLLIAMTQFHFDVVDPLTYAAYVIKNPKRFSVPEKQIIVQEAIGDAQVPNVSTRLWARTMGIPALKSLFQPVFGLELKDGPLDGSAYTQFGPILEPYPKDINVPAKGNPAHGHARKQEGCLKQMETFFRPGGKIQHFCDGPCDPD
jgi:hypothetical protein